MGKSFRRPLTESERFLLFEDPTITHPNQLPSSIRRNKTVRADIQGILARKRQGAESNISDLQSLIRGIARPISFNVPAPNFEPTDEERAEARFVQQQRDELRNFIQGVRSGRIAPEVTDPEQRSRLIERASGDFGRALADSQEALFGELNRRGLLGTGGGFSGPTAAIQARERARVFEDPLTSFIRDLDIATEAERVNRQQELNDLALGVQDRLLGSGENLFQFLKNLRLGQEDLTLNRNLGLSELRLSDAQRRGSLIDQLLARTISRQESALNRDFQQDQFNQLRRAQKRDSSRLLPSKIGGILGEIAALPLSGGASLGGSILKNVFGSTRKGRRVLPTAIGGVTGQGLLNDFRNTNVGLLPFRGNAGLEGLPPTLAASSGISF